jgi:hypothetical protein
VAKLEDLKKAIGDLPTEELQIIIAKGRGNRRTYTERKKVEKSKKTTQKNIDGMSLDELRSAQTRLGELE